MHPITNDPGAYISAANVSQLSLANSAGTRNGVALAINDTRGIVLAVNVGVTTGTPDSFSIIYKLQESTDGSTFTDATDRDSATVTKTITAASAAYELDVDLQECCNEDSTHIRFLETVAFVNGTTPTVNASALIIRGPGQNLPL